MPFSATSLRGAPLRYSLKCKDDQDLSQSRAYPIAMTGLVFCVSRRCLFALMELSDDEMVCNSLIAKPERCRFWLGSAVSHTYRAERVEFWAADKSTRAAS